MKKEINFTYGEKLKQLRIMQFKTQKQMAANFKITQQAYSDLEKGKTNFTEEKIKQICMFFNVPFTDFITLQTKQRKIQTKHKDSYPIKVLKEHYEIKILELQIKIDELKLENGKLKRIKRKLEE